MFFRNPMLIVSAALMLQASAPALGFQTGSDPTTIPDGMVLMTGGVYTPLYNSPEETEGVRVGPMFIDVAPVTNEQFLAFVTANPRWKRSEIAPIFADETYLRHWQGDLSLGGNALPNQPVTNVSWFAAKAYAEWIGRRLPTVAEWELVAMAGKFSPDGLSEPGFKARILALTSAPVQTPLPDVGGRDVNYWGVRDMHGLVWEWVSDFNSALITGESRGDANLERKLFCGSGVVGASDFTDYAAFMRFAFRGSLKAHYTVPSLGFRTVKDVDVAIAL